MQKKKDQSILRIRTFNDDISRVRGIEVSSKPKLIKKKPTAQHITDSILETDMPTATNFINTPEYKKQTSHVTQKNEVPAPTQKIPLNKTKPSVRTHAAVHAKTFAHDLKAEIKNLDNDDNSSAITTEGATYDASNNDLSEGTIITDKKQNNFHLFPAIASAFSSWFGTKTKKLTNVKKHTPTLDKAESRIATLTAAATASKHAPQDDHGVVVKRLTKKERGKTQNGVVVKQKRYVAAPQWTSTTTNYTPLVEPMPQVPLTHEPQPIDEEIIQVSPPQKKTPPVSIPEVIQEEPDVPKVITTIQTPSSKEEGTQPLIEKSENQKELADSKQKKSGPSIYVYILVIIGSSLLGIGVSVYWFISSTSTNTAVVIHLSSLLTAETKIPVPLKTDGTLLSTILDVSLTTRETALIYPTITNVDGYDVPADTKTILGTLSLHAPGSFMRSITDSAFGSYNGTEPFIVLKITDFDTAFGGLLQWEPNMSTDLSALFGMPVTQSYDPYANTDTQIRSAFFRDTISSNKSVRLLVDTQNKERLMYAFVTPNIVLITPNKETFKAILPLIKH